MTARQQVMAVMLVLGLAGLVDFATRVYVPRSETERGTVFDAAPPRSETQSLAEARQRLQSWLPDERAAAAAGNAASGVADDSSSANEDVELPDRGKLAGRLYVLRGIFDADGGQPFAVLEIMPEEGGPLERHDVVAGDEVGGARVESIDGRRISLSGEGELIHLSLFLDAGTKTVAADESE